MTDGLTIRNGATEDLEQLTATYNHYVLTSPATFDIEPFTTDRRRDEWFCLYHADGPH